MGKFKGTNGNWEYHGGDNNSIDIVLPDETTVSIDRISRYTGKYVLSREGMEANAKLIAAAPEMLEALQHTLEVLYQCDPPKELFETYANVFANYNDLIHRATE